MRRQLSSKSYTCTESMDVNTAGISVKVGAHYPGRSANLSRRSGLLAPRGVGMGWQKSAEGIVGLLDQAEGPNMNYNTGA